MPWGIFGLPDTGNSSNNNNGQNPAPSNPSSGSSGPDFWSILTGTIGNFAQGFGQAAGNRTFGQNTPAVFGPGYGTNNGQPTFNGQPGIYTTAGGVVANNTALWVAGGVGIVLVGVVVLVALHK